MWAVVPIRSFDDGKHRLAPVLEDDTRRALVEAMFLDVLDVLVGAPDLDGILVVTRDPAATARAKEWGVEVLEERSLGLNRALTQAAEHLRGLDSGGLLVVPGDVPLATRAELGEILAVHDGEPALTLVPDLEGQGTNALACSPPELVEFQFGVHSAGAHLQAGLDEGARLRTLRLPGFGLDVDTAADLGALLARGAHTRSGRLLVEKRFRQDERVELAAEAIEAGGES